MKKIISASIVLYRNDSQIIDTIKCFLNTDLPVKLFLIDNSPDNRLHNLLKEFIDDYKVEYIFNNKNVGFGTAHNIALRKSVSLSKYHLVLNPDIIFNQTVIPELVEYMDSRKDVGLVMPKIMYPDGSIQYVCKLLPAPYDLLFKRFIPVRFIQSHLNKFQLKFTNYDKEMEVPYLSGCFMFIRVEALNYAGFFDENFFMYPEDIDLTRRIHKHYKTMFYPNVQVIHEHEQGSYKSFRLFWIHIVNLIKYFNKWGWIFDKERSTINKKILKNVGYKNKLNLK